MTDSSSKTTVAGFSNAKKDESIKEDHTEENKKGIENHLKAAEHFALASKLHYEAATQHEEGNYEKANQCALLACGHASLANDFQMQDARHHALEN